MAVNGNFFKLYNIMGNYRNLLSSRIILPVYQPVATLKKSIEEKMGLPLKPKRPLTPYFMFIKELRPSIVEEHPNLKVTEVTKMIAQKWSKTDEKTKEKLQKEYSENLKQYEQAKTDYYTNFSGSAQQRVERAKMDLKHAKQNKIHEKVIKGLGKPKRPAAAYTMWVGSLRAKRGPVKLSEFQKSLVKKWEALPEKEKEVFEQKATEAMNNYKHEIREWEEKMMKLGNSDLIRYGVRLNPKPTETKKSDE